MKLNKIIGSLLLTSTMLFSAGSATSAPPGEKAITFKERGGQTVDAFEGSIMVLENRNKPGSREIPVKYVRFPATTDNPGSPIIYLAGGPGGSGIRTARDRRFAMFMALRAHGDVIALDQEVAVCAGPVAFAIADREIKPITPQINHVIAGGNRKSDVRVFRPE